MNGVSRHLGLLKSVAWEDDSKPFFFASPDITLDKIWIDWQPVDEEVCSINDGLVRTDPFSVEGSGMPRSIQYVDSLVMYQLWDKELKNLFYFDDGTARPKLKYIASTIQKEVPIMWDEFVWDEAYWDVVERSMNGINYIPNIWDADINAWRPDGQRIDREEESKYGVFDKSKWDSGAKWK
jgi:hypothetical protein